MMLRVAALWRHPVKSLGREELARADLTPGRGFPWDRVWAVLHEAATHDPGRPEWLPSAAWVVGTRAPRMAATWARLDEASGRLTLAHPDQGWIDLMLDDAADQARLIAWLAPLVPADRAAPKAVVRLPDRGMTDTDWPSVSVMFGASHRAVAGRLGRPLEPERWRGNIWIEGTDAWAERDWLGRRIRIGTAELRFREPVQRCLHTAASPATGERDADTLGALQSGWGHREFGLYAEVTAGGTIRRGATVDLH